MIVDITVPQGYRAIAPVTKDNFKKYAKKGALLGSDSRNYMQRTPVYDELQEQELEMPESYNTRNAQPCIQYVVQITGIKAPPEHAHVQS